ncbi:MAG: hypothetical protein ACREBR_05570 [bacterium]
MTYIPLTVINTAIGSPEADNFVTVVEIANDIIFDKTTLSNTLNQFGVPASPSESLIALINKVHPLSVNYITNFSDLWTSAVSNYVGNSDSTIATLFTNVEKDVNSLFDGTGQVFTTANETGQFYLGGDAIDMTQGKPFVVTSVVDATHLQVISTAGMVFGDTLTQGVNSTSITAIIDLQNILVGSTSGWVAYTLVSSF